MNYLGLDLPLLSIEACIYLFSLGLFIIEFKYIEDVDNTLHLIMPWFMGQKSLDMNY